MKNSNLKRLLLAKTKPAQMVLALTGAFLGILIMMYGIQIYRDMHALLNHKDLLSGDFLVINKKVGILNTISGTVPGFEKEEIKEISNLDGVDNVAGFSSSNFKVSLEFKASAAGFDAPAFKSIIFFESVPDDFVDVDKDQWHWKPGDAKLPVILNEDFLKLYNTAFAQSQNLPVIPEGILKSVSFDIIATGNEKEEKFTGKIIGFSKRINSILVPQSYLDYGNKKFGIDGVKYPTRLILHCKDPANPALANGIKKLGYELNEDKLKASELNSILLTMIITVFVIGFLIVLLALLGFMQYNQLLAYRSAYEIQTLHWLGFSIPKISFTYIRFSAVSVGITLILSIITLAVSHIWFANYLGNKGFDNKLPSIGISIAMGVVISLLMAIFSAIASYKQVSKLSGS